MDKQGLQLDKPSFLEGQPTGWVGGELIHLLYGGLIPDSLGLQAPVPTPAAFLGEKLQKGSSGDENDGRPWESEH
jgi:hypothetical protein